MTHSDQTAQRSRPALEELLSECKQWRTATLSRPRLIDRRGEAIPLTPDRRLFQTIDRAEAEVG